jgi:hypothetical protein
LIAARTRVSNPDKRAIPRAPDDARCAFAAQVREAEPGTAPEAVPAATRAATTTGAGSKRNTPPGSRVDRLVHMARGRERGAIREGEEAATRA